MKSFDELKSMSEPERLAYLHSEADKLIANAAPHNQLKMRALQAQCDGIRKKYRNQAVSCCKIYSIMLESGLFKLNDALLEFKAR